MRCSVSADARKLDEFALSLQENYPRAGVLRRKGEETPVHGPVSLFEAVTAMGRKKHRASALQRPRRDEPGPAVGDHA